MRKLIYVAAASLDGQIAREDGSFDCFTAQGDHIADYLASSTPSTTSSRAATLMR